MIILDVNLLLYAYDASAPQQKKIAAWLEDELRGAGMVGLPWVTIWGFLRISTNPRLWQRAKTVDEAWKPIEDLLANPSVVVVEPGRRHLAILKSLAARHQSTGPKMTDALLAALAMENNAVLASTDQGFARFSELRWLNPLA